ncbi:axonemal dynein light chain domain-containing protein 1 [Aulostomus maculatus]
MQDVCVNKGKFSTEFIEFQVPAERRQPSPHLNQTIPDELLASLTSTVCSQKTLGHTAHSRRCKGCGIRRPDAVWHHPLGREKYKYFLEQPTSLTGAGRDISFLCDALVSQKKTTPLPPLNDRTVVSDTQGVSGSLIPEEYHIVTNKGLQSLEFYEDAFTVQLKDEKQKPRVFPSLRPSGRMEVLQLLRTMDTMLEKAGVDQQSEELTELSQMEGLLEVVHTEQNIYNVVFHELIRQVSVGCAERGQLLSKLRQRYQSLLERIPRRLKALHTEVMAQRALDRRLTEEIHRIKTSIQQLSTELSKIRDQEAYISHQAEHAHQELAEALDHTNSELVVIEGYHELYELQRGRLEAQLLQMTEEKDLWSHLTFCLALKVISTKKLRLVSQLHISEQSWFHTAEHCSIYITSKDTEDMNIIMELTDSWKDQLTALTSHLRKTEHAQCEQIGVVQQGITKWLKFCTTQNKSPEPKYEKASLGEIHADLKQWSDMLAQQCELYQGEELLGWRQTLAHHGQIQEQWLVRSRKLFRRHPDPDGNSPGGQQVLRELDQVISEHHKQLDTHISGESGIHRDLLLLLELLESWVTKLRAAVDLPAMMPESDWLKLENSLHTWLSLAEQVLQKVSSVQGENQNDKNSASLYTETEKLFDQVQEFIRNLSTFTDCESQRLTEEISSIHMAQAHWMLDLLLLMVPDHSENQGQEQEHKYVTNTSPQKLDEDSKVLAYKLDSFSRYLTSSCQMIVEGQGLKNPRQVEGADIMTECRKLQKECIDWVETCRILLSRVKGDFMDVSIRQADPALSSDVPVSAADGSLSLVKGEVSAELDSEVTDEIGAEPKEGAATEWENPEVRLIGYDGDIMQRKLGESRVCLSETEELVMSPVTDEAQKAFKDLSTVVLLQQELHVSELRVQTAELRALKAEEALQAALVKIKDLERQLQDQLGLEPTTSEEQKPSTPPVTDTASAKKSISEAKPASSSRKSRKC